MVPCPSEAQKTEPKRLKKKGFYKFKVSLGYLVSSRSVGTTT